MSTGLAALIDPAERLRLERAVVEARVSSGAELSLAVAGGCGAYADARWRCGVLLAALAGLGLAAFAPGLAVAWLLLAQALALAIGFALARFAPVRRGFVADAVLDRRARERAETLFASQTETSHGVLLFVALFERRLIAVAGDAARAALPPGRRWSELLVPIRDGLARGDLPMGIQAALEACADALPPGPTAPDPGQRDREPAPPRLVWLEDAPVRGD